MLTTQALNIQTVSEITKSIKVLLETGFSFVTVLGEISNLKKPHSGHLYFTLKDQTAQLSAVIFKQQLRYLEIKPADGLLVVCRGRITLYEPRGTYQLLIDSLEPHGAGQLRIAFDKLKKSLEIEGLFDQSAKQALPFLPNKVSLITSPGGAAIHDFLRTAENRFPGIPIEIIPVRVQGDCAADEIVEALTYLNHRRTSDVIVLCRGGGSLEDLWAFNEEKLARAIYESEIPIVSAIGHEIDFTISDFVADFRAATPTAAAEAVIPDKLALLRRVKRANYDLGNGLLRILGNYQYRIETQRRLLGDPSILVTNFALKLNTITKELARALEKQISVKQQRLKLCQDSLIEASPAQILMLRKQRITELSKLARMLIRLKIDRDRKQLGKASALLNSVSPLAVLARGYAIARDPKSGDVIRDSAKLSIGAKIEMILEKGGVEAEVTRIKGHKRFGTNY